MSCFFLAKYSYNNSGFCKKRTASIEIAVVPDLQDADLEYSRKKEKETKNVNMFLCPFYISDIPGLTLEILKILIPLCFRDALQPAIYMPVCQHEYMIYMYSICLLFTSISYVQENFELNNQNQS